jgi:hypothetical protein
MSITCGVKAQGREKPLSSVLSSSGDRSAIAFWPKTPAGAITGKNALEKIE